jgi:5-methylcytosine-specific restriction endonuclease McrA
MRGGDKWKHYSNRARRLLQPTIDSGVAVCSKCGGIIHPGQLWDVDHIISRDRAPHLLARPDNWTTAHRSCNRSAGARYGNRKRGWTDRPTITPPAPSREW